MGIDKLALPFSLRKATSCNISRIESVAPFAKSLKVKIAKSNLVRVTIEEINSIRPSVYKYLLP